VHLSSPHNSRRLLEKDINPSRLMQPFRFSETSYDHFCAMGAPVWQPLLAFFSLLSLFPLVFLLLYGLSFVVSHDVIGEQVLLSFLKGFIPSLENMS